MLLTRESAIRGTKVMRGPAWCYDSQDGGAGHKGVIIESSSNGATVRVEWEHDGSRQHYHGVGSAELVIYHDAPMDPKYPEPSPMLVGYKILINDNQGCSSIKEGSIYEVERYSRNSLVLDVDGYEVYWKCDNNSIGKYFEIVEKPKRSRETPVVKDDTPQIVSSTTARLAHLAAEQAETTMKKIMSDREKQKAAPSLTTLAKLENTLRKAGVVPSEEIPNVHRELGMIGGRRFSSLEEVAEAKFSLKKRLEDVAMKYIDKLSDNEKILPF